MSNQENLQNSQSHNNSPTPPPSPERELPEGQTEDNNPVLPIDEPQGGSGRRWFWVVIIIILFAGGFWLMRQPVSAPPVDVDNGDEEIEEINGNNDGDNNGANQINFDALEPTDIIQVSNQPAGDLVAIPFVSLDRSSWVAVREESNGGIGNILGARWLPAGDHENERVRLLRNTEPGGRYLITFFPSEDSDEFDYESLEQATRPDGEVIMATFMATGELESQN